MQRKFWWNRAFAMQILTINQRTMTPTIVKKAMAAVPGGGPEDDEAKHTTKRDEACIEAMLL